MKRNYFRESLAIIFAVIIFAAQITVSAADIDIAADAVEKAALGNPSYSSIDRIELSVSAFMHDTGMDGGTFKDYTERFGKSRRHSRVGNQSGYGCR